MLGAITNVLYRASSFIFNLLLATLAIPYLGEDRFGALMVIISLINVLLILDAGIGNALTNRVSNASANLSKKELSAIISKGLILLFYLSLIILFFLLLSFKFFSWSAILNIPETFQFEFERSLLIFFVLYSVYIFSYGIQKIFAGLQKYYLINSLLFVTSLISIVCLIAYTKYDGGMVGLVLISFGFQILGGLCGIFYLFKERLISFTYGFKPVLEEFNNLRAAAGTFLTIQIAAMAQWSLDSVIISSVIGLREVTILALSQRLFLLIPQISSTLSSSLWGAYADAHFRNDFVYIRQTLFRSMMLIIIFAFLSFALIMFYSKELFHIWLGYNPEIPNDILLFVGLLFVGQAIGNVFAMFLNGCNVLKQQFIVAISMLLVIPIKFLTAEYLGLSSMLQYSLFYYVGIHILFYGFLFRKTLSRRLFGHI